MKKTILTSLILSLFLTFTSIAGAQGDFEDYTPLMKAVTAASVTNNFSEIKNLIANGAEVNAKNNLGYTPLTTAIFLNNKPIVELLIQKKADVKAVDNQNSTVIMWAAYYSDKDIIEYLFEHGATNINARNDDGWTALGIARSRSYDDPDALVEKYLTSLGAVE